MSYEECQVKVYDDRTVWRNAEGEYHREDGPAVEHSNGTKQWYQNGKRHREDGPAIVWGNGSRAWYLNGECMTEEEHAMLTWENLTQEQQDDIIFGEFCVN